MRDAAKGGELTAACASEGLDIEIRTLDVCDDVSVAAALHDADTLDVIVNNAGFEVQAAIELVDDELLARQFQTNIHGPMRLIRKVLPVWRNRGSGTIVNVSSIAGRVGAPYGGAYSASKFALEALSEALHFEVGQLGINVRLIEPGRFDTGFHANIVTPDGWGVILLLPKGRCGFGKRLAPSVVTGRRLNPQEVARCHSRGSDRSFDPVPHPCRHRRRADRRSEIVHELRGVRTGHPLDPELDRVTQ